MCHPNPVQLVLRLGLFDISMQLSNQEEDSRQDFRWQLGSARTAIAADLQRAYFIMKFSGALVYLSLVGLGAESGARTEQDSG